MNKRHLKQSAMDDFMRSLEELNDLLGHDSDSDEWEEDSRPPDPMDDTTPKPSSASDPPPSDGKPQSDR